MANDSPSRVIISHEDITQLKLTQEALTENHKLLEDKNQSLNEVCKDQRGRGYLEWMLGKDFNEEVKDILRSALDGVFPKKNG